MYHKASDLLGFVPLPKKRLGGKNHCQPLNLAVKKEFTAKRVRTCEGSLEKSRAVGSFGQCEVMLQITSFG